MRSASPSKPSVLGKVLTGGLFDEFAASPRADFRFAPLNALLLVAVFVAGLVVHLNLYSFSSRAVLLLSVRRSPWR